MVFRYILSTNEETNLIINDPLGWEDTELRIERGLEYHGLFYNNAVQLKFICKAGKEIIDDIYNRYGIEGYVAIKIGVTCKQYIEEFGAYSEDYSDDYETYSDTDFNYFFEGKLDLKTLIIEDEYTTCDVINTSYFEQVRNRMNVDVRMNKTTSIDDIDILPCNELTFNLHSKTIKETQEWLNCNDFTLPPSTDNIGTYQDYLIPSFVARDDSGGYAFNSCGSNYVSNDVGTFPSVNGAIGNYYIYTNETVSELLTVNINLDCVVSFYNSTLVGLPVGGNVVLSVKLYSCLQVDIDTLYTGYVGEETTFYTTTYYVPVNNATVINVPITFNNTDTIQCNKGHKLYLSINVDVGAINTKMTQFDVAYTTQEISFTRESFYPSSTCKAYQIHDVGQQIVRGITGTNTFKSDLLGLQTQGYSSNGCGSHVVLSKGKQLRGLNSALTTNLNNYFNSLNTIYNIGLGIEQIGNTYKVVIEEKEYFYQDVELLKFDWVNSIRRTIAQELYFNNIEIGFSEWEIENTNGIDEFNTTRKYSTGIKEIETDKAIISPYVAGGYAIEYTRRMTNSEDSKYDDKVFIIATNKTNLTVAEKNENFNIVNNIVSPSTCYNLRFAPTKCLTRHMNYISSNIYLYDNRNVKFLSNTGNAELQTKDNLYCNGSFDNKTLTENQNINWQSNNLDTPLWINEYIEFEYPLTFTEFFVTLANNKGYISVSGTDTNHIQGYIISISYKPTTGMAQFKLLRKWQG